jgi:hypothetical protein
MGFEAENASKRDLSHVECAAGQSMDYIVFPEVEHPCGAARFMFDDG